jgi:hypothetical protein
LSNFIYTPKGGLGMPANGVLAPHHRILAQPVQLSFHSLTARQIQYTKSCLLRKHD